MRRLLKTAQRWFDYRGRGRTAPPFVFVAVLVATLSGFTPTPQQTPAPTPPAVLHGIDVQGDGERLVITLRADRPIAGELQATSEGRTRLFVDLHGVQPQVPVVTPVNRGPLRRIRTALHSGDPLITRVVFDVSKVPAASIESDARGNQLRVLFIDTEQNVPGLPGRKPGSAAAAMPDPTGIGPGFSPAPPGPAPVDAPGLKPGPAAAEMPGPTGVGPGFSPALPEPTVAGPGFSPGDDKQWCLDVAERVGVLLDDKSALTSQPAMRAASSQWEKLEQEVRSRPVSPALQSVHFTLLEAVRLGRIASTYYNARDFERASAAHAVARLMLETAQTRLEQMQ